MPIRFDVYGRFELELERRGGRWLVFRRGEGKRRPDPWVSVPPGVPEEDLEDHREDLLHELARPGYELARITECSS